MKPSFYFFALLVLVCGCSSAAEKAETLPVAPGPGASPGAALSSSVDSVDLVAAPPLNTIQAFLEWYARHQEQLNTLPLVPAANDEDTTNQYTLDFRVAERFVALLQQSKQVTPAYLEDHRRYFRQCQDSLLAHPQTQGPPQGLDFDQVLYTQDAEAQTQLLLRSRPSSIVTGRDTARIVYRWKEREMSEGPSLAFSLVKSRHQWQIQAIRPIFEEVKNE